MYRAEPAGSSLQAGGRWYEPSLAHHTDDHVLARPPAVRVEEGAEVWVALAARELEPGDERRAARDVTICHDATSVSCPATHLA